jgi:four helix bundle protein
MHSFRKLSVWRKAHALAVRAYGATSDIADRRFSGLADDMRRAAVAVPASIAEGAGQDTAQGFVLHLEIALASARELEYRALLAADVGAMDRTEQVRLTARIDQVSRMLIALKKTVATGSRRAAPRAKSALLKNVGS